MRSAHAAALAESSTWATSPSGICKKRVPRARKDSTSPVHRNRYAPSPRRGLRSRARPAHAPRCGPRRRPRRPAPRRARASAAASARRADSACEPRMTVSTSASRSGTQYAAHGLHHLLVEREAALDDRSQIGTGDALQVNVRIRAVHRALVGLAGHGGRRGHQPDPAAVAAGHGQLGGRADHADHVDLAPGAPDRRLDRAERRGAGRVAGDDQQLGAGGEQVVGDLDRERLAARTGCARRRGTARCRPGTGSPRRAATRAARATRSTRRRRSRTRRWAGGRGTPSRGMVPEDDRCTLAPGRCAR